MKKAWLFSAILHIMFLVFAFLTVHWSFPDIDTQDIEALPIQVSAISDTNSMRKGQINAKKTKPPAIAATTKEKVQAKHNNAEKSKLDTDKRLDKWADDKVQKEHEAQQAKKAETKSLEEKPKEDVKKKVIKPEKKEDKPAEIKENPVKDKEKKPEKDKKDVVLPQPTKNPKVTDKKEAKPQADTDDLDKLIKESLFIDKARTHGGGKNNSQSEGGYGGDKDIGDTDVLAQTLSAKISSCVRSKFNVIALGGGAQTDLKIHIRFSLKKDGSIDKIEDVSATGGDGRLQEIGINQANAALHYCSPFDLPRDKYQMWQAVDMVFDPYAKDDG